VIYDDYEEAERALENLTKNAKRFGITSWLGRIETRYCSPFSDTDLGADIVADLTKWMENNE
jgi:hypothetical protein